MKRLLFLFCLAGFTSAALAQPKVTPKSNLPALLQGKPHVEVAGTIKGKCSEYVSVGDTLNIPQWKMVRSAGKLVKMPQPPRLVERITYVRALPKWSSLNPGDTIKLEARDCYLINNAETTRTVQYWAAK